ncbi:glycosyltransferase family 25 protein [Leptothrix sp. BB-4]
MTSTLTLVINLDRDTRRLARIATQLDALGLPWTRIPAVYGARLTAEERARLVDVKGYGRRHGMTPNAGEIGCYLSHLDAARALLASDATQALVLEDDVGLLPDLPAMLDALAAVPERWDMVKLSAVHRGTPQPVVRLGERHHLTVMLSQCTGSSAYVMNRHAAQVYLDRLLPIRLPFDHAYDRSWTLGIKVRRVDPLVALHDSEIESSISAVAQDSGEAGAAPSTGGAVAAKPASRVFPWHRRLPTYGWRVVNELRRVTHGLLSVWRERGMASAAARQAAPQVVGNPSNLR